MCASMSLPTQNMELENRKPAGGERVAVKRTKPELYEEIRQLKKKLRRAEAAAAKNNVFVPHTLKTIEVDAEEKIFMVNGEPFGAGCTGFTITCFDYESFDIRMEIGGTVKFVSIRGGECTEEKEYPTRFSWYSQGKENGNDADKISDDPTE